MQLTIDGQAIAAEEGWNLLQAALSAGIYVPALCAHPDLPPMRTTAPAPAVFHGSRRIEHDPSAAGTTGCGLCAVEVEGEGRVPACATPARDGMQVTTASPALETYRRSQLAAILAHHPHACLTCSLRDGCTREPCSMNVPPRERCCSLLGRCELQAVADCVGIDPSTPRYVPGDDLRVTNEPLFDRDPALCFACGRCVRACNDREARALGWARDPAGRAWVGPLAATPLEAGCRWCGSCVEVCPTGALMDRGIRPAERSTALVPCRAACPAGTDVPRYVRLVAAGAFLEAAAVVAERAPLVEVLGQICFHPCETACRRNEVNGAPVSICRVKREAGALAAGEWTSRLPPPLPGTGKRAAVVGGGPAGLMAAHVLRLLGHAVTLVEARSTIGGMLAHAIPAFRLAPDVARRETEVLVRGIAVRTNMPVGSNGVSIEGLRGTHDAVVVAAGASLALRLDAPGEDRPEVRTGLDLLAGLAARLVDDAAYGNRRVLVVGGGNVAIDCARAAIRLGAWGVDVVCLEQPHEMPAYAGEVRAALDEGVRFHHGWGVQAFTGNGRLYGAVLKRCARVFDENARFDPVFDERDTATLPADAAIVAVGQRADGSLLPRPLDGVFTAGDFATGPRSVVEAIASGREAALAADRYLGGAGALTLQLSKARGSAVPDRPGGFAQLARLEPATVPAEHRVSLSLMPRGLGPVDARREADRCLRCDLRLAYRQPVRPPSRHQRLPLSESNLPRVPEAGGVLRFYDQEGETLAIVGAADMRQDLAGRIPSRRATAFDFETCAMYTQRQNELLSRFVEAHGRMPPGVSEDDDLDGLF